MTAVIDMDPTAAHTKRCLQEIERIGKTHEHIHVITLAGGMCGGKTTYLDRLRKDVAASGWSVIVQSENATTFSDVTGYRPDNDTALTQFQRILLSRDIAARAVTMQDAEAVVRLTGKKVLIITDRAPLCRAFDIRETWEEQDIVAVTPDATQTAENYWIATVLCSKRQQATIRWWESVSAGLLS